MFRRGFKTWSEETAGRVRQALRIAPDAPLNPALLAELLKTPVLSPEQFPDLSSEVVERLVSVHRGEWSAITVTEGLHRLIVLNSAHSSTRQNSSLAHEIAHVILNHEPSLMFLAPGSGVNLRTHNKDQEEEAGWLSSCLLLPRAALLSIRRKRLTDEQACSEYIVSREMLRYRLNATGVDLQMRRLRRVTAS